MKGHSAAVNAVAVTDDASKTVSASSDGTVKVWNTNQNSRLVLLNQCRYLLAPSLYISLVPIYLHIHQYTNVTVQLLWATYLHSAEPQEASTDCSPERQCSCLGNQQWMHIFHWNCVWRAAEDGSRSQCSCNSPCSRDSGWVTLNNSYPAYFYTFIGMGSWSVLAWIATLLHPLSCCYLVSGAADQSVKVWDFITCNLLHSLPTGMDSSAGISSLSIGSNGRLIVSNGKRFTTQI